MRAVYAVRHIVEDGHVEEWTRWQDEEHSPRLLQLPGYLGMQRFAELDVQRSFLNIWRLERLEAHGTPEYRAAAFTPWFKRIAAFCEIEVSFSVEDKAGGPHDEAPWRADVTRLVVDRADPDGSVAMQAQAQAALAGGHRQAMATAVGVTHAIRLHRLSKNSPAKLRSAKSDVVLAYIGPQTKAVSRLAATPPGVQRRIYRPITPYRTPAHS
jgi:hypothetical protein